MSDTTAETRSSIETISILGLPLACTDYPGAIAWIKFHALIGDNAYAIEAANTQVVTMNRVNPAFAAAMARFDLIVPDGMPLVWAINLDSESEKRLNGRVYGPTLMLETLEATSAPPFKHFLLGGKQDTLDCLTVMFSARFPGISLATHSPPFGEWPESEFDLICKKIRSSGANLIWVGLGCPKQEHWIAKNKDRLPPGVYFGIGAAFAFHSGEVSQAPAFIQRRGMEWAYRLAMEPRRLFRRYFTYNSLFIYHLIQDRILGKKTPH